MLDTKPTIHADLLPIWRAYQRAARGRTWSIGVGAAVPNPIGASDIVAALSTEGLDPASVSQDEFAESFDMVAALDSKDVELLTKEQARSAEESSKTKPTERSRSRRR